MKQASRKDNEVTDISNVDSDGLCSSWKNARLVEVCDIILGQSPPSDTYNVEGKGLPFFQGKAEFGDFYPTPVKWCSKPKKIAEAEDVLISVRAPVGPTNLCPSQACIGRGLAAIRPREGTPSRYLLYAMRATVDALKEKATGSTFEAINGNDLKAHIIPFAPPNEQIKIVSEIEKQFTRLDAGVTALKRAQANLKRYRAAVLKAACEGKLVPTEAELARKEGRTYETGEQLLARILEERRKKWQGRGKYKEPVGPDVEKLPGLPEGWGWANGSQLFTWSSGEGLTQKEIKEGPYPVYGGNGITGFHKAFVADFPTLVIGRVGAQCGNIYLTNGAAWITDNAIFATMTPTMISLKYVQLPFQQTELNKRAAGSGQPFVNQKMLNETILPLPPFDEQNRIIGEFEKRLSVVEELEMMLKVNFQRASRLRQSVLQYAFGGHFLD